MGHVSTLLNSNGQSIAIKMKPGKTHTLNASLE